MIRVANGAKRSSSGGNSLACSIMPLISPICANSNSLAAIGLGKVMAEAKVSLLSSTHSAAVDELSSTDS